MSRKIRAGGPIDLAGAAKKIRQAEFFLAWLAQASRDMVNDLARNPRAAENAERLEFLFSACLTAGQSSFYVLRETGGLAFARAHHRWRTALALGEREEFNRMISLRDADVHYAKPGAQALRKFVAEDRSRYATSFYNAAIFGPAPVAVETNPDGAQVSGPVLRGTIGLYIDSPKGPVDAENACRVFVDRLHSLLQAAS